MRLLRDFRLFVVVLAALVLAGNARAQDIYLRTATPELSAKTLRNDLPAFQAGANKLHRWWGGEAIKVRQGRGSWQITVLPSSSAPLFVAGYHYIGPGNVPYAVVFYDSQWTQTLSHELDEMAVDPSTTRTAQGTRQWLVEVCDPVERFSYPEAGANGNAVRISDFVGPQWYTGGTGYFDKMGKLSAPEQIAGGGYAVYWDGVDWVGVG